MKTTLTFEIDVDGDRSVALDRRDEIIDVLKRHGIDLVLTDNGMRIVMYDHGEEFGTPSATAEQLAAVERNYARPSTIQAARDDAAQRNAQRFGTDPSWYGQ